MHFINKENNVALSLNLFDKTLYSALKLTSELRTGNKRGEVEKLNFLIGKLCRNLTVGNSESQALCNSGFTDSRLTYKTGIVFALADGACFENTGRGYVLRRLLRRSVRYGKILGLECPFMYKIVSDVVDVMKDAYPYLLEKRPIIDEERSQFEYEFPKSKLKPKYTDEVTGLQMIKDFKTALLFTTRNLKDSEIAYLKSKSNVIPSVFPIGYDGLAFIVNKQNNDTCITVKDIKRILTGKATKWSDIVKGSKRGDIEVIFDNTRSATTNYVVDSVLHGAKMGAKIMAAKTSKEVIDYVDQNPGSIGVIGSNWLNDRRDSTNTTFKKNIHVMRVSIKDVATPYNSWQPYQAYLLDGRYPFVRTLYAIVVDPHKALPWSFANYISGPRGQLILFKTGLLPYRGDITIKTVNVKR